jgi:hypothetical protein
MGARKVSVGSFSFYRREKVKRKGLGRQRTMCAIGILRGSGGSRQLPEKDEGRQNQRASLVRKTQI